MGGVFSSKPALGFRHERIVIRGFNWCDEEEFLSRAKRLEPVSLESGSSGNGGSSGRIDWSSVVESSVLGFPRRNSTWMDPISLCAAVQAKIGGGTKFKVKGMRKLGSGSRLDYNQHLLIVLDKDWAASQGVPRYILKINKPGVELVKDMVAKYPVVTSIRCTERRGFPCPDEYAQLSLSCGLNPQTFYCGDYDMDCIPRCALLVGFDKFCWTIFDPGFNYCFNVHKSDAVRAGVGEFILVPLAEGDMINLPASSIAG